MAESIEDSQEMGFTSTQNEEVLPSTNPAPLNAEQSAEGNSVGDKVPTTKEQDILTLLQQKIHLLSTLRENAAIHCETFLLAMEGSLEAQTLVKDGEEERPSKKKDNTWHSPRGHPTAARSPSLKMNGRYSNLDGGTARSWHVGGSYFKQLDQQQKLQRYGDRGRPSDSGDLEPREGHKARRPPLSQHMPRNSRSCEWRIASSPEMEEDPSVHGGVVSAHHISPRHATATGSFSTSSPLTWKAGHGQHRCNQPGGTMSRSSSSHCLGFKEDNKENQHRTRSADGGGDGGRNLGEEREEQSNRAPSLRRRAFSRMLEPASVENMARGERDRTGHGRLSCPTLVLPSVSTQGQGLSQRRSRSTQDLAKLEEDASRGKIGGLEQQHLYYHGRQEDTFRCHCFRSSSDSLVHQLKGESW